jgi:acyl-coenzyme A thioesterase PaaI-like protein
MPATGAINPTVDLNVQLIAPPPSFGTLHVVCHPVKMGRRLFVGEVLIDCGAEPFARGMATFLNQPIPGHHPDGWNGQFRPVPLLESFDDLIQPSYADDRTVVVACGPAINNGPGGTVQGGVQATIAELASEWVLSPIGNFAVTDLDIRYVGRVKVGPVAAAADVLSVNGSTAFVRVTLVDRGNANSLVSTVATVCHQISGDGQPITVDGQGA